MRKPRTGGQRVLGLALVALLGAGLVFVGGGLLETGFGAATAAEAAVQEVIHPGLDIANREVPFNAFEFGILMPRDPTLKNFVDEWLEAQEAAETYQQLFDAELVEIEAAALARL